MITKRILTPLFGLVLTTGLIAPAPVVAAPVVPEKNQIVVTGVVPELRIIVIDQRQNILLVTSNTNHDVAPRVVLLSMAGPVVPLTKPVQTEYEAIIGQLKGDKTAAVQPEPAPLSELFPSFIESRSPTFYKVMPARRDEPAYWISGR